MKLLNLACGAVRPQSTEEVEWWNLDNLHASFPPGTPERDNLDKEPHYVNHDLLDGQVPIWKWEDGSFDGILCSHFIEHVSCHSAHYIMGDCRRLLKPGGTLLISVPDASYFRRVYDEDTVENAERLFGEPIHLPDGETTFFGYGLWNRYHKAILTEDALWSYFKRAGFTDSFNMKHDPTHKLGDVALDKMVKLLNRLPFSLIMAATK